MVILKTVFTTIILGLLTISCNNSPTDKEEGVREATQDLMDAKADLDQAESDSINDFIAYKEIIQLKLVENQQAIDDLKQRVNSKGKVERDIDEVEINKLEKRNTELMLKIQNYEQGPEQKWELFRVDFNNELDDLGKSISSMADRNMKK